MADKKREGSRTGEFGLIGALTVIVQLVLGQRSQDSVTDEIAKLKQNMVAIQEDILKIKTDRQKYFARKEDIKEIAADIQDVNQEVKEVKQLLKKSKTKSGSKRRLESADLLENRELQEREMRGIN